MKEVREDPRDKILVEMTSKAPIFESKEPTKSRSVSKLREGLERKRMLLKMMVEVKTTKDIHITSRKNQTATTEE